MEEKSRSVLPGELRNCFFHCGYCKKRNLYQDFEKDEFDEGFKCPSCGRIIKRVYANKEEKLLNKPIMEKNRNDFIHRWKTDFQFRERYRCIKIKD